MDKWEYIKAISNASDKFGNLLIEMMDKYDCINLQEISEEQTKEFYEEMIDRKVE